MRVNQGECFKDVPYDHIPHLHVVIFDVPQSAELLIVSITSYTDEKDDACVIEVGEHPFIKHKSCVSYRNAKVISHDALEAAKNAGKLIGQHPASAQLIEKIIGGLTTSGDVPRGVRGWLKQYNLI